jgi:hypothetical protein
MEKVKSMISGYSKLARCDSEQILNVWEIKVIKEYKNFIA